MDIKLPKAERLVKVAIGIAAAAGGLAVSGNVSAEECPTYPPSPCNTVPPESTVPNTTIETTTTLPYVELADTGRGDINGKLALAFSTLIAGAAIAAGVNKSSHRRAQ